MLKKEVLTNYHGEQERELDRYLEQLGQCETEEDGIMCIAHHIMNYYDIQEKYAEHEQEIEATGIVF